MSPFGLNRYAYANDNPVRFTDPDGRNATAALGGVFYELWSFATGNGFHGSRIVGALKDGYNGQGAGLGGALKQDAMAFVPIPAGKLAQGAKLLGKAAKAVVAKLAPKAAKTVVRTTRSGEKAVRITRADGSVIDISPQRVKEYVPNTHPKAPPGTLQKVRFRNSQPGSKGFKRDPTPDELRQLKELE